MKKFTYKKIVLWRTVYSKAKPSIVILCFLYRYRVIFAIAMLVDWHRCWSSRRNSSISTDNTCISEGSKLCFGQKQTNGGLRNIDQA